MNKITRPPQLVILISSFITTAVVASAVYLSHAASTAIAFEPENGTLTAPAQKITDSAASGGAGIKFTTASSSGNHVPNFGSGAPLLYQTDYTNRDERSNVGGPWWLHYPGSNISGNPWNPTYLTTVAAPWNASKKAVRAVIHNGDNWEGTGYPRSELMATGTKIPDIIGGQRYFISFGFQFPSTDESYLDNNTSEMVGPFQIHHPEGTGSPPIGFFLTGRTMQVRCMGGSYTNPTGTKWYPLFPAGSVPMGRYVAIDIEYVPRNDASGMLKIWADGTLVANHSGACSYTNSANSGYIKMGLYDYFRTVPNTLTLYLDDLTIRKQ